MLLCLGSARKTIVHFWFVLLCAFRSKHMRKETHVHTSLRHPDVLVFFLCFSSSPRNTEANKPIYATGCADQKHVADRAALPTLHSQTQQTQQRGRQQKVQPIQAFPLQLANHDDAASRCDRSSTATAPVVAVLCSRAGNGDTDTGRETGSISRLAQDTARGLFG